MAKEAKQTYNIRRMAANIANTLRTSYAVKKHGGYNIYEDDRIHISLDTYVPNVDIAIRLNGTWTTVFAAASGNTPSIFKPGLWVEYLHGLQPQCESIKTQKEANRAAATAAEHDRCYGPVDDTALFLP